MKTISLNKRDILEEMAVHANHPNLNKQTIGYTESPYTAKYIQDNRNQLANNIRNARAVRDGLGNIINTKNSVVDTINNTSNGIQSQLNNAGAFKKIFQYNNLQNLQKQLNTNNSNVKNLTANIAATNAQKNIVDNSARLMSQQGSSNVQVTDPNAVLQSRVIPVANQ